MDIGYHFMLNVNWPLSGRARLADLYNNFHVLTWPNARTTRRQHAANMLSPGQGSPDPVRAYHAHWAKCAVGEAAPAFIFAGEAIEPGVTVVWGVHWGGHPPPDQDDPAHHTPHPPAPKSCHQFAGM